MPEPSRDHPVPSWYPRSLVAGRARELEANDPAAPRRLRLAAVGLLLLGGLGITIGCIVPEAGTELVVGAVLILLAVRALYIIRDLGDRTPP